MILLTKKQKGIFDYLEEYIGEKGYAPSIKEICDHFGTTSVSTMHKQLLALEQKGYIKRIPKMSRAIELIEKKSEETVLTEIPVMGSLTEGKPIESTEMIEYLRLPEKFSKGRRVYLLKVVGNFFSEMLIGDGDYVVIESKTDFMDGQIALIRLDKRNITLRKVSMEGGKIKIHPLNLEREEKFVDEPEVIILGVVIGVIRDYL
ncbi:transcriptional repressor LexA [bacterium]|nr:transcriptional repressor LexA [bacterium]